MKKSEMAASKLLMVMVLMLMLSLPALSSIITSNQLFNQPSYKPPNKCCCSTKSPNSTSTYSPEMTRSLLLNNLFSRDSTPTVLKRMSQLPAKYLKQMYSGYSKNLGYFQRLRFTGGWGQLMSFCKFYKFRSGRGLEQESRWLQSEPRQLQPDAFMANMYNLMPYYNYDGKMPLPEQYQQFKQIYQIPEKQIKVIPIPKQFQKPGVAYGDNLFVSIAEPEKIQQIPDIQEKINQQKCRAGYLMWIGEVAEYLYDYGYYNQAAFWLQNISVPHDVQNDSSLFTEWAKTWLLGRGVKVQDYRQLICTETAVNCNPIC